MNLFTRKISDKDIQSICEFVDKIATIKSVKTNDRITRVIDGIEFNGLVTAEILTFLLNKFGCKLYIMKEALNDK